VAEKLPALHRNLTHWWSYDYTTDSNKPDFAHLGWYPPIQTENISIYYPQSN